jgi:alpha-N-arabinofuranosidase
MSRIEGKNVLLFRRQIGSLWKIDKIVEYRSDSVTLILEATPEAYVFKYKDGMTESVLGSGEASYLSTEVGGVFTGTFFALYCTGTGVSTEHPARFGWFDYREGVDFRIPR